MVLWEEQYFVLSSTSVPKRRVENRAMKLPGRLARTNVLAFFLASKIFSLPFFHSANAATRLREALCPDMQTAKRTKGADKESPRGQKQRKATKWGSKQEMSSCNI